jgi:hypothetical protein
MGQLANFAATSVRFFTYDIQRCRAAERPLALVRSSLAARAGCAGTSVRSNPKRMPSQRDVAKVLVAVATLFPLGRTQRPHRC